MPVKPEKQEESIEMFLAWMFLYWAFTLLLAASLVLDSMNKGAQIDSFCQFF